MRINITIAESYPDELDSPQSISTNIMADLEDSSVHAYYKVFEKVLAHAGFTEKQIMLGATHVAFNESRDIETMRKVADEYELILDEDSKESMKLPMQQDKLIGV